MILGLTSNIVNDIVQYGGSSYYLTAAGLDVVNTSTVNRTAWLLGTFTCIAVNDKGLWFSNGLTVSHVLAADVATGGDLTSKVILNAITNPGTVVHDIAAKGDGIVVVSDTAVRYHYISTSGVYRTLPNEEIVKCCISSTRSEIILASNTRVFSLPMPGSNIDEADWIELSRPLAMGKVTEMFQDNLGSGGVVDVEAAGNHFAVTTSVPPYIRLYSIADDGTMSYTPPDVDLPASQGFLGASADSDLVIAGGITLNAPMYVYRIVAGILTLVATIASPPFYARSFYVHSNSHFIRSQSNGLTLYKIIGTVVTELNTVSATTSVKLSPIPKASNPNHVLGTASNGAYNCYCYSITGDILAQEYAASTYSATDGCTTVGDVLFAYNYGAIGTYTMSLMYAGISGFTSIGYTQDLYNINSMHTAVAIGPFVFFNYLETTSSDYKCMVFGIMDQASFVAPFPLPTNESFGRSAVAYNKVTDWAFGANSAELLAFKANVLGWKEPFTAVNSLIADDILYVGTDNGIRIVSLPNRGTEIAGKSLDNFHVIKEVTKGLGSLNVKSIFPLDNLGAEGTILYGTDSTGGTGQFGILDLTEI
jgi:hypothetical protein